MSVRARDISRPSGRPATSSTPSSVTIVNPRSVTAAADSSASGNEWESSAT